MVFQCAIIFGCLALGELIVWATGIKLPSSIIGMLLLTLFLQLKWIKLRWVEGISNFLVKNLGFFFVPPGVALMLYLDIIKDRLYCDGAESLSRRSAQTALYLILDTITKIMAPILCFTGDEIWLAIFH